MNDRVLSIKGIYRDVMTDAHGVVIHDSGWVSNTIVDSCRFLLAGFIKNEAFSGIQYLQVGEGEDAWDEDGVSPANSEDTKLVDAFDGDPLATLTIDYLDESGQELGGEERSAWLQITARLEPGYPTASSYPLREFGLFGTFDPGEGGDLEPFMINNIRHPVIYKDASATLIRVVRVFL